MHVRLLTLFVTWLVFLHGASFFLERGIAMGGSAAYTGQRWVDPLLTNIVGTVASCISDRDAQPDSVGVLYSESCENCRVAALLIRYEAAPKTEVWVHPISDKYLYGSMLNDDTFLIGSTLPLIFGEMEVPLITQKRFRNISPAVWHYSGVQEDCGDEE